MIEHPEHLATVPDIMNNLVIQALRTDELGGPEKNIRACPRNMGLSTR